MKLEVKAVLFFAAPRGDAKLLAPCTIKIFFFCCTDLNMKVNCKLTSCEILKFILYFVKNQSLALTEEMTGKARMMV